MEKFPIGSVSIANLVVVEQGGGVDIRLFVIDIWYPPTVEISARIVLFGQLFRPSKIRQIYLNFLKKNIQDIFNVSVC